MTDARNTTPRTSSAHASSVGLSSKSTTGRNGILPDRHCQSPFAPIVVAAALLVALFTGAAVTPAHAQSGDGDDAGEQAAADTAKAWMVNLSASLNGSQAAYREWREGGVNTLTFTTSVDGTAEKKGNRWTQTHDLRLAFGIINQEEQELRKSDDLIRLASNFRYRGNGFFATFKPTVAANLRSQFATGFNYTENPYPDANGVDPTNPRLDDEAPVRTSSFFSPAFIQEAIGLTYEPTARFSARLGVASKQTVVLDQNTRVLYDVDRDKAARIEGGADLEVNFNYELATNVRYETRIGAFYAINQTENPPDVIWENLITLKVNDWLNTNFEFVALYDKNTVDAIQMKEILSVGVNFVLI